MPWSPLTAFPAGLHAVAANIRLACFDVDGTLTDGRLYYDHAGNESKAFYVQDGLGLKLLQQHDIHPVLITARNSLSAQKRGADLGIDTQIAVGDKLNSVRALCEQLGIDIADAAAVGDTYNDIPMLERVGHSFIVDNAEEHMNAHAKWRIPSNNDGGVLTLIDAILAAR